MPTTKSRMIIDLFRPESKLPIFQILSTIRRTIIFWESESDYFATITLSMVARTMEHADDKIYITIAVDLQ